MKDQRTTTENAISNLQNLSPERRALLALRLKQNGKQSAAALKATGAGAGDSVRQAMRESERAPIERLPRDGRLPLSFAQRRLWFIDQLEPGSSAYNLPGAYKVAGPLDVIALNRCFNVMMARHEALRTTFQTIEGKPVQVIAQPAEMLLPVADLRGIAGEAQRKEVSRIANEEAAIPFDLASGPLVRVGLLRLDDQEHVLLLTMHHIISDGWSSNILVSETAALYDAFTEGKPSPLAELEIQYADFAHWQTEWLKGETLDEQLSYWKRQLGGDLPALDLPADRPRPAAQTYRGGRESLVLSSSLGEAFKALCRREGVSLFMGALAAFKTLLHRYTGQKDILAGTPIANRNRREVEGVIGFFLNTLIMRTDLSGDPTFSQLLARVREMSLGAYAHQDLPFETLVEALQPERNLSLSPLFQVMFVFQNNTEPRLSSGDLIWGQVETEGATSKFDLTMIMQELNNGRLRASFEYSADLFDQPRIANMLAHFEHLLEAITANPERRLSEFSIISDAEAKQAIYGWNDTGREFPQDQLVHKLFEMQVERAPRATAIVFEGERLSYNELNARANKLAHHLQRLGAGPDSLVGVCLERGVNMLVATLGILKSGAAYAPLDPAYPKERLGNMIDDAQAPLLVTERRLAEHLPVGNSHVIKLDADWPSINCESDRNPSARIDPDNLAYVIYTSGSTGRPKGIGLAHRPLANLIHWHLANMISGARTLQFASLSFDASFHEMFSAWASGGELHVISEELRRDLESLAKYMSDARIEKATLPVVVLQQLAEHYASEPRLTESFKEITTTGEQLQVTAPIRRLFERMNSERENPVPLFNHYGPSETHVVTSFTMDNNAEGWPMHPPIGRPIWNTSIYILDENLKPAPIGAAGELYAAGVSLARGYLNRADQTAERFLPDPYGEAGSRMYRTGDVARYRAGGEIEYLGRADHQVKIRGYRIELGEIEAALSEHPAIVEVAVIAREDQPGKKRLAAYYVSEDQAALDTGDLQRRLKQRLPDYMIPSAFIHLAAMPLTPNGKLDRRALPAPESDRTQTKEFVAPRNQTEELLAAIIADVLGIERVGVYDNFFEEGGHSLLATQVISRIRKAFDIALPLRALFEAPTIAELASRVGFASETNQIDDLPPIKPIARDALLPLSFSQRRLWLVDQLEPGKPHYNIPAAIRLEGRLDAAALGKAFDEITRRHEILRTCFPTVNGEPTQCIYETAQAKLELADFSHLPEDQRAARAEQLANEQAQSPFDLASGPLLRATLIRLGDDQHIALFVMHHIITDGWSMGIFTRELVELYHAFATGNPSPLAPLPVQYADYAFTQREWLQGESLDAQLAYWRSQLAGKLPQMKLPFDKPRPPARTYKGESISIAIAKELSDAVINISRRESATLYMTLLAAYDVLLHCYSNQSDILVGSPIANRRRIEIEDLIGFFVNTLVMRADLSGDPTFRELLGRVRKNTIDAYAHQDVPFEKLVEALQPERSLGSTPLFQVEFTLQNAPAPALGFAGLEIKPLESANAGTGRATAQYDLMLDLFETSEGLVGSWRFSSDLFYRETVAQMATQFDRIIALIAADPDIRLSAIRQAFTQAENQHRSAREEHFKSLRSKKLKAARRTPVASA